ncbi:HAMP domain-containing sensor histidine kinase [Treponema bryantii]|uniref:sensor histidine kinase n=1 Tax=Treponema bryantii TaxID=163 RepID=UPI002B28A997|nr:histidine kinase [Treponema bryantii]
MKKLRLRFPINIQISIFLILVAFIPVAAMMMLKTYESQMLTMMENSNVQQARIISASLELTISDSEETQINRTTSKQLLQNMNGKFDARIRILSKAGELLADSSTLELENTENSQSEQAYSSRLNSLSINNEKTAANDTFIYKLFSIPIRIYRKLKPPAASFTSADFYSGKIIYDGEEVKAAQQGRYGAKTRISGGGQVSVTLYSAMPVFKDNEVIGIVLVSRSTWRILQNLYELRIDLAKVFLWSLVFILIIAVFLTFRISVPLKKLARQTSECADKKGRIDAAVVEKFTGLKRKDEIGDLSRSFKTLIKKLDSKIHYTQAFASDVNHEFKNPLAAIRSSIDILKDSSDEKEKEEFTQAIVDEVNHLEHLLNGVRGISKIEGAELPKENLPIKTFTQNIADSILKNNPDVRFELQINTKTDTILLEPDYYERILSNLIENAAGFAKHIRVIIETISSNKTNQTLVIKVADNGPGISEENASKIFDRFYSNRSQSLKDSKNKIAHTGLGLSIVKAICDEMEGEISVSRDSELGGALFEIKLPFTVSKKSEK